MRRIVINVHRVINSRPLPPPPANPLLYFTRISPFTSQTAGGNDSNSNSLHIDLSNQEAKRRLFNRLLYRSKQRGFLELDLVLGKWVEDNIHSLDENQIQALVHILDLGMLDDDLFAYITNIVATLLKTVIDQNNLGLNLETLATLFSTLADATSAPRSSTSTHSPEANRENNEGVDLDLDGLDDEEYEDMC